jgi:hypothetical protein
MPSIKGVDVAMVGPADLSISLGLQGCSITRCWFRRCGPVEACDLWTLSRSTPLLLEKGREVVAGLHEAMQASAGQ